MAYEQLRGLQGKFRHPQPEQLIQHSFHAGGVGDPFHLQGSAASVCLPKKKLSDQYIGMAPGEETKVFLCLLGASCPDRLRTFNQESFVPAFPAALPFGQGGLDNCLVVAAIDHHGGVVEGRHRRFVVRSAELDPPGPWIGPEPCRGRKPETSGFQAGVQAVPDRIGPGGGEELAFPVFFNEGDPANVVQQLPDVLNLGELGSAVPGMDEERLFLMIVLSSG